MRALALILVAACGAASPHPTVANHGGAAAPVPPWAALFELDRAWILPVTVTTTPADGAPVITARTEVTCKVTAATAIGEIRRATITCLDPDRALVSYAPPRGYLIASPAGLWYFPADDSWLGGDDHALPTLALGDRVMRWPLAPFSLQLGELDAFERREAWSDGADRWCAIYYGQAGDRGGHELCLTAATGIVSGRQWREDEGSVDAALGPHRLPRRPPLTTTIQAQP